MIDNHVKKTYKLPYNIWSFKNHTNWKLTIFCFCRPSSGLKIKEVAVGGQPARFEVTKYMVSLVSKCYTFENN